nr:MAG TPA: minor tail protein [Caudoviricetes sp.]
MASKNINVLLSLVDKFTAPLKKPVEATQQMQRQIQKASNRLSSFGSGVNNRFLSITNSIGKLGIKLAGLSSFLSVGAITAYANKAIASAESEIEVQTKLGAILQNVESIKARGPDGYKKAQAALNDYAAGLSKVGVVGKGVILNGMQQLATFQLNEQQISMLSDGMADLLVQQKGLNATGEDAVGIANMIGKAMGGNASALSRVGITMSETEAEMIKNGDAMQRASVIANVLKNNVGGVNKAMAETDIGKQKKAQMQYGAMAKDLGMLLLPIKTKFIGVFAEILPIVRAKMKGIFEQVASVMDGMTTWFAANGDALANGLSKALEIAVMAFKALGEAVAFFGKYADYIIPILSGIVAGFVAFNVITKVVTWFKLIKTAMQGAQVGMAAFNAVMAANPIVLVAIGIAALVALIVALVMHWDEVKAAVIAFGQYCGTVIEKVKQWFVDLGLAIEQYVSNAIESVIQWFVDLGTAITTAISDAINWFASLGQAISDAIMTGINAVFGFVNIMYEAAAEAVNGFIEQFSGVVDGIAQIFQGITDFITGVFTGNWDQAISGLVGIFTGYFETIKSIADIILGSISEKISTIGDGLSKVKNFVFGGGDDEKHNATGTSYWQGGSTYVNENNRGEGIILPSGSEIIPHDETVKRAASRNSGVQVNITIQGNVIGNEQFMDECGRYITDKVRLAMSNM